MRLREDRVLVRVEVDHVVGQDDVEARVREGELLRFAFDEVEVRGTHLHGGGAALASICGVMSMPMTLPSLPTIWAATSESVPAPEPRSSTRSPGASRPSENGLAMPAKDSAAPS